MYLHGFLWKSVSFPHLTSVGWLEASHVAEADFELRELACLCLPVACFYFFKQYHPL